MNEVNNSEISSLKAESDKIEDLQEYINQLEFFSNNTRFNSVLYQGISFILEKMKEIDDKLNKLINKENG